VAAKAGLIGAFYSASPKRGIGGRKDEHRLDFFDQLGLYLCRSEIDEWLSEARTLGLVNSANVNTIAALHGKFDALVVRFLNEVWSKDTRNRRAWKRTSFCSKYLHFHVPKAFPIYDSVILERLQLRSVSYLEFCSRFVVEANKRFGVGKWNPRLVDMTLYPYRAL
jgi:hypothetical protein